MFGIRLCVVLKFLSWTDCVRNEVLHTVKEERNILRTIKKEEG